MIECIQRGREIERRLKNGGDGAVSSSAVAL